jgi:drug/metabolite transporter (DMT)-like permease
MLTAPSTRTLPEPVAIPRSPAVARGVRTGDQPLRAIGLFLLSIALFSISDAISKELTRSLPAMEVAWMRYLWFVLLVLPVAVWAKGAGAFRPARPGVQSIRAFGLLGSTTFFVAGLVHLPMAEATAITFVAPIFVTALAVPVLGETVGLRRWLAVAVGLGGMLIVVRPGSDAFSPAAIFPLLSALSWAVALVATRLGGDEPALTALNISALVGFVALSAVLLLDWTWPSGREWAIGAGAGIAATAAQALALLAYRSAPASVLAPFSYSQLLWSTALGLVLFSEVPDGWTGVGAAVIIASGLYTAHRERLRASDT